MLGANELHTAVLNEKVSEIQKIVNEEPALINKATIYGETPLVFAVRRKNMRILELLIGAGANVNRVIEGKGFSPLHTAISAGNIDVINRLISAGANINDDFPLSPLHLVVESENLAVAEILLKKGAQPNVFTYDGTPLHYAVKSGNLEMVKLLVRYGSDSRLKKRSFFVTEKRSAYEMAMQEKNSAILNIFMTVPSKDSTQPENSKSKGDQIGISGNQQAQNPESPAEHPTIPTGNTVENPVKSFEKADKE